METLSKTLNKSFDFKTTHVGLFLDDTLWSHDKWIVVIEGQTFDYSTGIGHRIEKDRFTRDKFNSIMNKNPKKTKENLTLYNQELNEVSRVKPLEIDTVLYSLLSDADCGQMLFDDFCNELGYDTDSIKHNEIYKACQTNAKKVRTFIKDLDAVKELFQDY